MSAIILRFPSERAGRTAEKSEPQTHPATAIMLWPLILGTAIGATTIAALAGRALLLATAKDG
jgi:hypothetical protein